MGTWGVKLYDDDVALDVKEEYLKLLKKRKNNKEATAELISNWDTDNIDDCSVFWIALADTQWNNGSLLEEVKKKAIEIIDNEIDLEKWAYESELYIQRKEELNKLKERLNDNQVVEEETLISKKDKELKSIKTSELLEEIEAIYRNALNNLHEDNKRLFLKNGYQNLKTEASGYPEKISSKKAEIIIKNFNSFVKIIEK